MPGNDIGVLRDAAVESGLKLCQSSLLTPDSEQMPDQIEARGAAEHPLAEAVGLLRELLGLAEPSLHDGAHGLPAHGIPGIERLPERVCEPRVLSEVFPSSG